VNAFEVDSEVVDALRAMRHFVVDFEWGVNFALLAALLVRRYGLNDNQVEACLGDIFTYAENEAAVERLAEVALEPFCDENFDLNNVAEGDRPALYAVVARAVLGPAGAPAGCNPSRLRHTLAADARGPAACNPVTGVSARNADTKSVCNQVADVRVGDVVAVTGTAACLAEDGA
jgi:hypothetical protein